LNFEKVTFILHQLIYANLLKWELIE